jgi:hypothetical protein
MRSIWMFIALTLLLATLVAGCMKPAGEWLPPAEATATYEAARMAILERRNAERTQTAAARPTQAPTATPRAPVTRATATPRPSPTPLTIAAGLRPTFADDVSALQSHMPLVSQVGEWYWIVEEGPRSAEALAADYPDADAHRARLAEWGFSRAAYRTIEYLSEDEDDIPLGLHQLHVTVSEFASPAQAAAALEWEAAYAREANPGLEPVERPALSDGLAVLAGTIRAPHVGPEAWTYVWVRTGAVVLHARGVADTDQTATVWTIVHDAVTTRPYALGAPMPTLADLPSGFYVYAEDLMSVEDTAAQFEEEVDPREHLLRLREWGYSSGFAKVFGGEGYTFTGPMTGAPPADGPLLMRDDAISGIVFIGLFVSEYASAEAAAAAAEYHWSIVRASDPRTYREVQVTGLGENAWALGSRPGGEFGFANLALIFAQHGNREYFVVGMSLFDSTLIDLVAIVSETMNRQ